MVQNRMGGSPAGQAGPASGSVGRLLGNVALPKTGADWKMAKSAKRFRENVVARAFSLLGGNPNLFFSKF